MLRMKTPTTRDLARLNTILKNEFDDTVKVMENSNGAIERAAEDRETQADRAAIERHQAANDIAQQIEASELR